jgi:hypothetical protein
MAAEGVFRNARANRRAAPVSIKLSVSARLDPPG